MIEGKQTVRAVERALDLLLCFAERSEWTLTELSVSTGLHKSTASRLLGSLEARGFLLRDNADKYRLGYRLWELSANLTQAEDPAEIALPEMERLRDALGETVSLYVLDGLERIRVQAIQSEQSVRRVAKVGARLSLSVGASSKVLVAFSANEDLPKQLAEQAGWTAQQREKFLSNWADVRRERYAFSVEEREEGVAAVAVPIWKRDGTLVATLSVSGPANRMSVEVMKSYVPAMQQAAARIGKMMI